MLTHEVGKGPKGQSGFTLIELLIVIAIIAILAAIAIPMFLKYKQGAYLDSVRSDVKNSVTAVEAFSAQYGDYPDTTTCPASGFGPGQCSLKDSANTSTNALNVSSGNTVTITFAPCSGTGSTNDGYTVSGYNTNITSGPGSAATGTNSVSYNSCTGQYTGF